MTPTIVVIEDDSDISEYIAQILIDNKYTVYTAQSGLKGLKLCEKINPDLLVLDLNLPDISGESVCKQLKADYPQLQVLILTAKDTPEDIARGLNIGADDYLAKPFAAEVLLARIKARLRGNQGQNEMLQVADLVLNPNTHEIHRGDKAIELSPQEFKLLYYLMTNKNKVLSREMILSRIWGGSPDIETRVVDVYIGYLRKKIDKSFKKKVIQSIRGFGYKLQD